ncbi:MAG: glutathione S-transferase family protein, partial [Microcoleus sp.]
RAIVRMVQMVTVNELVPAMSPLVRQTFGGEADPKDLEKSHQQVAAVLTFFEGLLGEKSFFCKGDRITLADIVAGVSLVWMPELGVSLNKYPNLNAWSERLINRGSWQNTQASPELLEAFKTQMKQLIKGRQSKPLNDEINEVRKEDK